MDPHPKKVVILLIEFEEDLYKIQKTLTYLDPSEIAR